MTPDAGRRSSWVSLAAFLLALSAWEAASRLGLVSRVLFPPPTGILAVLCRELGSGRILPHLAKTVALLLLGSSLGALGGTAAAILCARWRLLALLLDPWIDATLPLPKVAMIPLFMILVGAGDALCLTVIALGMAYSMFISVRNGIARVDKSLVEAARNLGADDLQVLREVTLPSLLPFLCLGAHLGLLESLRLVVIMEAMFSLRGMGHVLFVSGEWLRMKEYYAAIVLVAALGIMIVWLLRQALRVLTPWAQPSFYDQ